MLAMYTNDSDSHLKLTMIQMISTSVFDLVLASSLLIIFIKKLDRVSTSIHDVSIAQDADTWNDDFDDVKMEVQYLEKNRLYNIMSKVTILGVIIIIISQIVWIFHIIVILIDIMIGLDMYVIDAILIALSDLLTMMHIFVTSSCILLGFECTNEWYKYFCTKCHKKTKQYCIITGAIFRGTFVDCFLCVTKSKIFH